MNKSFVALNKVIRKLGSFARAQITNRIKNKPINQIHTQSNNNNYKRKQLLKNNMTQLQDDSSQLC